MKYYAIRKGRKENIIVTSWAECSDLVSNYKGAEYKSFGDERDAKAYLFLYDFSSQIQANEEPKETKGIKVFCQAKGCELNENGSCKQSGIMIGENGQCLNY